MDIPHELVHSKAHEMWHRTSQRLAAQGVDPRRYLQLSGKTEEELVTEAEPDAERASGGRPCSRRSSRPRASRSRDDESRRAARGGDAAGPEEPSEKQLERSLKRARSQGADEALREDIAMRKAVDLVVEHAKPIPLTRPGAREAVDPGEGKEQRAPARSGRRAPRGRPTHR